MAPSATSPEDMLPGQMFLNQDAKERNKRAELAKRTMAGAAISRATVKSSDHTADKRDKAKPSSEGLSNGLETGASKPKSKRRERDHRRARLENTKTTESDSESESRPRKRPQAVQEESTAWLRFQQNGARNILKGASPDDCYYSAIPHLDDKAMLKAALARINDLKKLCNKENSAFKDSKFSYSLELEEADLTGFLTILETREARKNNPETVDSHATTIKLAEKFHWVCTDIAKMSHAAKDVIQDGMARLVQRFDGELDEFLKKQKEIRAPGAAQAMEHRIMVHKKIKQVAQATRWAAMQSRNGW